jgi:hypothetical protein
LRTLQRKLKQYAEEEEKAVSESRL